MNIEPVIEYIQENIIDWKPILINPDLVQNSLQIETELINRLQLQPNQCYEIIFKGNYRPILFCVKEKCQNEPIAPKQQRGRKRKIISSFING